VIQDRQGSPKGAMKCVDLGPNTEGENKDLKNIDVELGKYW